MREIGVRELKGSLSRTLRDVHRGQPVRVTVRGRPVAEIVPVGAAGSPESRMRELIAEGRLTAPTRPLPKEPPPLIRGRGSASDLVIAEREEER